MASAPVVQAACARWSGAVHDLAIHATRARLQRAAARVRFPTLRGLPFPRPPRSGQPITGPARVGTNWLTCVRYLRQPRSLVDPALGGHGPPTFPPSMALGRSLSYLCSPDSQWPVSAGSGPPRGHMDRRLPSGLLPVGAFGRQNPSRFLDEAGTSRGRTNPALGRWLGGPSCSTADAPTVAGAGGPRRGSAVGHLAVDHASSIWSGTS